MVIQGAFRGAGQTKVAMVLSLLSRWVFRVPVAIALAFTTVTVPGTALVLDVGPSIGVVGIWISYAVGGAVTFLVAVLWFRLGRWTEGVIEGGGEAPGTAEELEADVD
jgi:Na+-driven multidrug efflux pump